MKYALVALAILFGATLLAPWLSPYDPMTTRPDQALQPPSRSHALGTDAFGRDVLSRLLHGGGRTLMVAVLATGVSVVCGAALAFVARSAGQYMDAAVVALLNALLAFPPLLFALVVLTLLGRGMLPLALATGCAQIAAYARVARAAALVVETAPYIEAAYAAGATRRRALRVHVLPNALPTLLAFAAVVYSYNLLNAAALSFLGLGGEPGVPDWGSMLAEGRAVLRAAPWVGFAPGVCITLAVIAVNRLARAWSSPR